MYAYIKYKTFMAKIKERKVMLELDVCNFYRFNEDRVLPWMKSEIIP